MDTLPYEMKSANFLSKIQKVTKSAETHQTLSMAMKKRQGREAITTATMVALLHFIQQSNVAALCTALTPDSQGKGWGFWGCWCLSPGPSRWS